MLELASPIADRFAVCLLLGLAACSSGPAQRQEPQTAGSSANAAPPGMTAPAAPPAAAVDLTAGMPAAPAAPSAGSAGVSQPSAAGSAMPAGRAGVAGMPAAGSAGAPSNPSGSALPPISDPGAKGPFEVTVTELLDGLDTHIAIAPKDLGANGLKHPIVIWINGAGANSSSYRDMLENVAANGFFVLDDKQSSFDSAPEVMSQRAAIDWVIAQAASGPYAGKLDARRIAIAGHSMGSVSTFGNVADMRIKTSIHMAGGLTGNPEGVDESWLKGLHAPAAFLVGSSDNGQTRCRNDFMAADPAVPLFLGVLAGVGHTDEFNMPNGGRWGRILIAWLRWKLADDASFAKSFTGADCEFCKGDWTAMKHALD